MRDLVRLAVAAHRPIELPIEGRRDSAVMVLLHEERGVEQVIFQVRTQHVEHHRGEISFPGGSRDPADDSLLATALRETHEEIGVPEEDVEVFGQLDDTFTVSSNYLIRPYVGAIRTGGRTFTTAASEVSELLRVPLEHLLSPAARTVQVVERDGVATSTPAYRYGEHVIWGATARVSAVRHAVGSRLRRGRRRQRHDAAARAPRSIRGQRARHLHRQPRRAADGSRGGAGAGAGRAPAPGAGDGRLRQSPQPRPCHRAADRGALRAHRHRARLAARGGAGRGRGQRLGKTCVGAGRWAAARRGPTPSPAPKAAPPCVRASAARSTR